MTIELKEQCRSLNLLLLKKLQILKIAPYSCELLQSIDRPGYKDMKSEKKYSKLTKKMKKLLLIQSWKIDFF